MGELMFLRNSRKKRHGFFLAGAEKRVVYGYLIYHMPRGWKKELRGRPLGGSSFLGGLESSGELSAFVFVFDMERRPQNVIPFANGKHDNVALRFKPDMDAVFSISLFNPNLQQAFMLNAGARPANALAAANVRETVGFVGSP